MVSALGRSAHALGAETVATLMRVAVELNAVEAYFVPARSTNQTAGGVLASLAHPALLHTFSNKNNWQFDLKCTVSAPRVASPAP